MKLFLATRWGHDEAKRGPRGQDTHFIVRAEDRDQAAAIVDQFLESCLDHERVEPFCHRLTELGTDLSAGRPAGIICGPWYALAGGDVSGYKNWLREAQTGCQWTDQDESSSGKA
jgi:hypothetical protein